MQDVAKLAGVATMTVSRVLNRSAGVTDALQKKVFSAVEQLRYQPNDLARDVRRVFGEEERRAGDILRVSLALQSRFANDLAPQFLIHILLLAVALLWRNDQWIRSGRDAADSAGETLAAARP